MRICKKCVQPDTRPGIYFNEEGVCGGCLWNEEKKKIDWDARERELMAIAEKARRTTKGNYDCVIGVSGGKDSTKQALVARDRMGLRPLLVNCEPDGISDIGRHNIENLKNLGFDTLSLRPNPQVIRKLIKRDFYNHLNPVKITEYCLWSSSYIVADKFDIPLIIQGENQGLLFGSSLAGLGTDDNALNANRQNTLSEDWREYLKVEGITEKDLYLYHYDRESLEKKGIRGIWLQYYLKEWSYRGNAEFSKAHGMKWQPDDFPPEDIGTYVKFAQLDTEMTQVNQLLKYIKFGFGQCVDHACCDLWDGLITREEAFELVRKYDGKCAKQYIQKFCDYIDITVDEFWRVANSFRGDMWVRTESGEWHNTYWDLVEQERNNVL